MEKQHPSQAGKRIATQHDAAHTTPAAQESAQALASPAAGAGLLQHAAIEGRGNAAVRATALQRMQQTYGNHAVQRMLHQNGPITSPSPAVAVQRDPVAAADPASSPTPGTSSSTQTNTPTPANPTDGTLIPFDRSPKSLPGEQVLFNDTFNHADPSLFQLVYTGTGGKFDSAAGSASKTIAGLDSGNLPFFVDSAWNGTSTVSVKLEVKRLSDGVVVKTVNWNFTKKTNIPTTITQTETEGERPLPSTYTYKVGPDLNNDGRADYEHQTVLESFGANTSNVTMADLKPAFKAANPGITTDAQLTTHFFGGSGSNGTFTIDSSDQMYDGHGGGMPDKATFEAALTTMKEIHVDLPQTYSAKPGVALGNYNIRRILKTDGTKKLKKTKV